MVTGADRFLSGGEALQFGRTSLMALATPVPRPAKMDITIPANMRAGRIACT